MKVREVRLFKNPNQSFVFYHETDSFSNWHYHPEYELVLIKEGEGIRLVGDHIERFEKDDLAFLGSYLPHEWRCLNTYYQPDGKFKGEGLVIQFMHDSFGKNFFDLPENHDLSNFLKNSSQGCSIYGRTRERIKLLMEAMVDMEERDRLYNLFSIFHILGSSNEFRLLSSPAFLGPYQAVGNEPFKDVIQYIHQNFQKEIRVDELLEISHMSNTTFFTSFKKMYRMTFKKYLLSIRIGYACRLLADENLNISQIAYESGFENLSNFNRQFKTIKGCTPGEYKKRFKRHHMMEII
jgi:AraC-like DNA-binding protein